MKNTFLICGFPRSRTMWLAHFLSIPGVSVCTHEATEFAGSAEEFWANSERYCQGVDNYGNSDSANLYGLRSLLAERPLTKVVWINRPMHEVQESMAKMGLPMNDTTVRHLTIMRDVCWEFMDLSIEFHALASAAECRQIWEFCLPDVPFDYGRWGIYTERKIGYSAENPMPQKSFAKFLHWAKREVDALKAEGAMQ